MTNEELEQVKKDATTFVDELKDKVIEQGLMIKDLKDLVKALWNNMGFVSALNDEQKELLEKVVFEGEE